jgi:hypothetical protein
VPNPSATLARRVLRVLAAALATSAQQEEAAFRQQTPAATQCTGCEPSRAFKCTLLSLLHQRMQGPGVPPNQDSPSRCVAGAASTVCSGGPREPGGDLQGLLHHAARTAQSLLVDTAVKAAAMNGDHTAGSISDSTCAGACITTTGSAPPAPPSWAQLMAASTGDDTFNDALRLLQRTRSDVGVAAAGDDAGADDDAAVAIATADCGARVRRVESGGNGAEGTAMAGVQRAGSAQSCACITGGTGCAVAAEVRIIASLLVWAGAAASPCDGLAAGSPNSSSGSGGATAHAAATRIVAGDVAEVAATLVAAAPGRSEGAVGATCPIRGAEYASEPGVEDVGVTCDAATVWRLAVLASLSTALGQHAAAAT